VRKTSALALVDERIPALDKQEAVYKPALHKPEQAAHTQEQAAVAVAVAECK
jgi:hypothetical protein